LHSAASGLAPQSVAGGSGFYLQDAVGDGDSATSDAVYVYTAGAPTVRVGDRVRLRGLVTEYVPGGMSTGNLSITELVEPVLDEVARGDGPLPAAAVVGAGGRLPPSEVVDDDALAEFLPELDGLDFYESLEGMRIVVEDAVAVSPVDASGETVVVAARGAGATGMNARGGISIAQGDMNPERIRIDLRWHAGPGVASQMEMASTTLSRLRTLRTPLRNSMELIWAR